MYNQDSLLIGNEDYLGKVYVVEFFFSRCPTICPIMKRNMKILDKKNFRKERILELLPFQLIQFMIHQKF